MDAQRDVRSANICLMVESKDVTRVFGDGLSVDIFRERDSSAKRILRVKVPDSDALPALGSNLADLEWTEDTKFS